MRDIIIKKTVYTFTELTDEQKDKAIEKHLDINVDHGWWDYVYEDASNIGLKIAEFDIDRVGYCAGRFTESAEEVAKNIIADHGKNCETFKTAKAYLTAHDELVKKHSDGINPEMVTEENEYDFDNESNYLDREFLRSLCEDYRIMLQKEYEYLTSREAIIATIEANEYELDEDGNLN